GAPRPAVLPPGPRLGGEAGPDLEARPFAGAGPAAGRRRGRNGRRVREGRPDRGGALDRGHRPDGAERGLLLSVGRVPRGRVLLPVLVREAVLPLLLRGPEGSREAVGQSRA